MTDTPNDPHVRRTSFTLPDDLARLLDDEAYRQRVSVSSLIRDAIVLRLALAHMLREGVSAADALDSIARRRDRRTD